MEPIDDILTINNGARGDSRAAPTERPTPVFTSTFQQSILANGFAEAASSHLARDAAPDPVSITVPHASEAGEGLEVSVEARDRAFAKAFSARLGLPAPEQSQLRTSAGTHRTRPPRRAGCMIRQVHRGNTSR